MIRVLVIGVGPVADRHLSAYSQLPWAGAMGAPRLADHEPGCSRADGEQSSGVADADLIDVCMPLDAGALARGLLDAQRPFLAAAPGAQAPDVLDRLIRGMKRRRVQAAVTQSLRFHPGFARVKEIADAGELGDLRRVEVRRRAAQPCTPCPAGLLLYQDVDLCNWLLGVPVSVTPQCAVPRGDLNGATGEGTLVGRLAYGTGVEAVIEARVDAAPDGRGIERSVAVEGGLGRVDCCITSPEWPRNGPDRIDRLCVTSGVGSRAVVVPPADPLTTELGWLAGRLARGEAWAPNALGEACSVLAAMLALREAARSGEAVRI